jgi:hypothetical protein
LRRIKDGAVAKGQAIERILTAEMRRFAPEKIMARSRFSGYGMVKENKETLGIYDGLPGLFSPSPGLAAH